MRQKPWDEYEAVILLEAYIQVHKGKVDRKKAISDVSTKLRKRALYEGVKIDDIYRNVAGITFQMYSMESAFFGKTIRKPATKLFLDIVQLRTENRKKYNELLKETQKVTTACNRSEYQAWLVDAGMKNTAARNYGNWLNNISEYALEKGYINISLYEYEDVTELANIYELLCEDEKLISEHRDYLSSLKKYILYCSNGNVEFGRQGGLKTTLDDEKHARIVELSAEEKTCFSKVLAKYFEEGLVLNAIRLDKFRMIYESEFRIALSGDDEYLSDQLKLAGRFIDGRIYPKRGEEQSDLLNEIRNEIRKVLDGGSSCVYISAVMRRWRQDLADQFNIFNETALRDLIISDEMSGVYATNVEFKMTKNKVYPDRDVLEFMKNCYSPIGYDRIQEELWYIPRNVIKHALDTTPSLVQVDSETYMYAPNFPASATELQHLIKLMKSKINDKGFLVSKDIAELIVEKCPTLAINTEGYKDWAYRNILRYILQDYFEFGRSVVSEKGYKLEMWQVYRGFCRDHEYLSVDELKHFSGEVGVQIYWDDVLAEMVRINSKELIRKDLIHFDVAATDHVLDEICEGDYMPIKQIGLFLHFPTVEYPWNSYLLESYLKYSKMFELYHVCYSENGVYGVVVKKNSAFSDYRQVVVDMLARSNEWSDINNALALIVEKGYQARKRWTGFDKVVQEALLRREHILAERK